MRFSNFAMAFALCAATISIPVLAQDTDLLTVYKKYKQTLHSAKHVSELLPLVDASARDMMQRPMPDPMHPERTLSPDEALKRQQQLSEMFEPSNGSTQGVGQAVVGDHGLLVANQLDEHGNPFGKMVAFFTKENGQWKLGPASVEANKEATADDLEAQRACLQFLNSPIPEKQLSGAFMGSPISTATIEAKKTAGGGTQLLLGGAHKLSIDVDSGTLKDLQNKVWNLPYEGNGDMNISLESPDAQPFDHISTPEFFLRAEFGKFEAGKLPVKLALCLPDKDKSRISGSAVVVQTDSSK